MKKSRRLALLVSMASMLPFAVAHAQSYNRLVSFGDSLSDNGNLFMAAGQPPAPYNQRFTNDKVWAEYLAGPMQGFFTATSYTTGNFNSAFGGARTDALVANPPGTVTQIQSYLLVHSGTFGANDVVSMWAGANDIFQMIPTAAGNPSTAAAVMTSTSITAATNVVTQTGTLATAGAKTIVVFNLPDLSKTPQFNTSPAAGLASVSSTAFNTALNSGLTTLAGTATGTNIVQVDVQSAFNAIIANPGAFGIANATQACINVTSCITGTAAVQNTYLFFDGVHPTATGHHLVANMAAQYLYTPTLTEGVGMMADASYNVRHANATDMAGLFHSANGYFVQVVGQDSSSSKSVSQQSQIGGASTSAAQKAYDYTMAGFRAGAVTAMSDNSSFGIGFTAMTGDSKAFMVAAKPTDLSVDVGMDWHPGPMFVTAQAGFGLGSYGHYVRSTTIAAFTETVNQIEVSSYSASLQAGLEHDLGGWTMTPVARLTYASANMKGFTEAGTIAAVSFGDRKASALTGAVEVRMAAKLSAKTRLSGVLGYESVLSSTEDDLTGKLVNNTAHAFSTDMGKVANPGMLVGVGVDTEVMGMNLSARYRGSFGSSDMKDQTAMISLNKAF